MRMGVMMIGVDRAIGRAEEAGNDLSYGLWSGGFLDHARFIASNNLRKH